MFANEWSVKSGGMWHWPQFADRPVKSASPACWLAVSAAVLPGLELVPRRLVRDERALVGRDRHPDARGGHGRVSERGGEQLRIRRVRDRAGGDVGRQVRRELAAASTEAIFAATSVVRAERARHLDVGDDRSDGLALERAEVRDQDLTA